MQQLQEERSLLFAIFSVDVERLPEHCTRGCTPYSLVFSSKYTEIRLPHFWWSAYVNGSFTTSCFCRWFCCGRRSWFPSVTAYMILQESTQAPTRRDTVREHVTGGGGMHAVLQASLAKELSTGASVAKCQQIIQMCSNKIEVGLDQTKL
jgi:hypothetical protein